MNAIKRTTIIKSILSFQLLILLLSCNSNDKKGKDATTGTDSTHATTTLPENAFAFKNIENSLLVKAFFFDYTGDRLYADPTKAVLFTKMDSIQKATLLAPVLTGLDSAYVKKYMTAWFIAKQNKIGEYTPIIVWASGDDYGALIYIVLNKEYKPVSHMILYGGEDAGPESETNATFILPPYKHSFIKGNEITSYILHIQESTTKDATPATIDSVSYKTTIQPDGQLNTKQVDSTRYKRIFKEPK